MVATQSLRDELTARGFRNIRSWSRGVDLDLFKPYPKTEFAHLPGPIFIYVGRVAVEKNIAAFLDLQLPGSKVVVGGGPQLASLQQAYPHVTFTGPRHGEALARSYAGADVFVFPSLTDTFGLVILEALACGTPVAAFPVTGPKDVLMNADGIVGAIHTDLRQRPWRLWTRTGQPAEPMRSDIHGAPAPRSSCRIWFRWRERAEHRPRVPRTGRRTALRLATLD